MALFGQLDATVNRKVQIMSDIGQAGCKQWLSWQTKDKETFFFNFFFVLFLSRARVSSSKKHLFDLYPDLSLQRALATCSLPITVALKAFKCLDLGLNLEHIYEHE